MRFVFLLSSDCQVRSFFFSSSLSDKKVVWSERNFTCTKMLSVFRHAHTLLLLLFLATVLVAGKPKEPSCSFKIVPVYSGSGDDLEGDETYNFNTRFVFPHPYPLVLIQTISSSLSFLRFMFLHCRKVKITISFKDWNYVAGKAYVLTEDKTFQAPLSGNKGSADVAVLTKSSSLPQNPSKQPSSFPLFIPCFVLSQKSHQLIARYVSRSGVSNLTKRRTSKVCKTHPSKQSSLAPSLCFYTVILV